LRLLKLVDDLNIRSVEFCTEDITYNACCGNRFGAFPDFDSVHFRSGVTFLRHIPVGSPAFEFVKGRGADSSARRVGWNDLPEDVVQLISSFLGKTVLESVRQKCIMDRYFPVGRDDAVALLKKWRNSELLNYSQHVFLKYQVDFDRYRWRRLHSPQRTNKMGIIDHFLRDRFRLDFYEFMRDIYLLTRILDGRRKRRR